MRRRSPTSPRRSLLLAAFVLLGGPAAHADPLDACIASAEAGQRLRLEAKLTSAREKLLACSQAECPTVLRADCAKWLAEVDRVFPSLVVRAVDGAGADIVEASVYLDGARILPRLDGSEIHVDPGAHLFRFVLASGQAVEEKVLIREGEQHRILSVVFPSLSPPRADHGLADQPPPPSAIPRRRSFVFPAVVVATGAVALGVAFYFWIAGVSEHSNLAGSCAPAHDCAPSAVDSAHTKLVAGDVVGAVGAGLVVVGAGLFLFGGARSHAPVVAFGVRPLAGGSMLTLGAAF